MNLRITPRRLQGSLPAISSKSHAHRLLICAALCQEPTFIEINLFSQDLLATIDCIKALGCDAQLQDGGVLIVPQKVPTSKQFDCRESGSTLRFMLPVAAALGGGSFMGAGRLPNRPLDDLLDAMSEHGVASNARSLPLTLTGQLQSGEYYVAGNVSSQYITGLLLALPLLWGDSRLHLTTALCSAGYVALTLDALRAFGIRIEAMEDGFFIAGDQTFRSPERICCEGDWSNSAFWKTAEFLGTEVYVSGLKENSSQKDRLIVSVLEEMKQERDLTFSVSDIPDLVPIISVAAACRKHTTVLTDTARLRLKESDRVQSVCDMITALDGKITADENTMTIFGTGGLAGGTVDGCNDHRIVMSTAIAATVCKQPVTVLGAQAADKSYPSFWADYQRLGGVFDAIDLR
ncbi:MAG: 3-phosphoshikimate 1-carboxyvinyltransferase [Clostridia bacterium]|nr:3-phosphoshikimate 1-carboxyvinyltransferase [Clostridia bacterium]